MLLSAFLICTGWTLSALHALNVRGYSGALALGAVVLLVAARQGAFAGFAWPRLPARRFRRALPAAFALLAGLIFISGAMHAPNIYDALAYRIPRVLAWIAEGRWHWIHTTFPRLNTRPYDYEWLTVPLLLFTKSDRGFFLINFVSLLLLPGLIFSTFTRLGISARVAWHWMWPLAAGYCFALEAGSIQSDLPTAPLALAMIDFALRSRKSGRIGEVWLSILAAALLTGFKSSALPLLLPWALALLPGWRVPLRRPLATALVAVVAAVVSFFPNAILNARYTGDWTGQKIESIYQGKNVAERFIVNGAVVAIHNFLPPIFPFTRQWNDLLKKVPGLNDYLRSSLEAPEMAPENSPGIGFGVCALLAASLVAGGLTKRRDVPPPRLPWLDRCILLTPIFSTLVLAASAFIVSSGARYFTPYYLLLTAPLLLVGDQLIVVRRTWWRLGAVASIALTAALNAISPAHPLLPLATIFSRLDARFSNPLFARSAAVYTVFGERPDAFAPIRNVLPPDIKTIGLIAWDDPETSLWLPFGTRRVRHVLPGDSRGDLHQRGVEFIVVSLDKFPNIFGPAESFDHWLAAIRGELWRTVPLRLRAGSQESGFRDWAIVRLSPDSTAIP